MVFVTVFECTCIDSTLLGHDSLTWLYSKLLVICENPGVPEYGSTTVTSNSVDLIADTFLMKGLTLME